jgi:negative regulator of sigma E activity
MPPGSYSAPDAAGNGAAAEASQEPVMSKSILPKAVSLAFAALVTLTITAGLDALAQKEQSQAMAARPAQTQTACVAPDGPRS